MSSTQGTHIYLGPWVNWSRGLILGSTITLSPAGGALLTSFLATFITVVGAQLWRILSYVFHQLRASKGPQDGLHHQQQIIFRNTTSPGGAAWSFLIQLYFWKNKAARSLLRTLPWALLAICYMILFGAFSVFSAYTTKATGDERLIIGADCGYWRLQSGVTIQTIKALSQKETNDTILASNYARNCYGGTPDALECSVLPVSSLPVAHTDTNATCPFGNSICVYGSTAAMSLDSGLIDSHHALGINAPKHARLQYRKTTTCAPLHLKGYGVFVDGGGDNGGYSTDRILQMFYGDIVDVTNYTFSYNTHSIYDSIGYTVNAVQALAKYPGNTWIPIHPLNRTDADITLINIAANAMRYDEPVDDPVFSAHIESWHVGSDGLNLTWWSNDYWSSMIGCADRHQFCNPNNGVCTPLGGASSLIAEALSPELNLNLIQIGAVERIAQNSMVTNIYGSVYGRGAAALRAQETVSQLDQPPLPATQWQIEVESWFNIGLARLQRAVLEYATGPTNVAPGSYIWAPADPVSKAMCYSQKVQDPRGTISFNLLGVAIILVLGTIILFLSLVLDSVTGWLQTRYKKGEYAKLNWILDDKLQLQRMVFEDAGMAEWEGTTGSVPTTKKAEKFGGWEGVDLSHPRLRPVKPDEKKLMALDERAVDYSKGMRNSLIIVHET